MCPAAYVHDGLAARRVAAEAGVEPEVAGLPSGVEAVARYGAHETRYLFRYASKLGGGDLYVELTLRLLAALAAGALLGVEREVRGHVAGVRTHALVAVGAALFTIVGAYGFAEFERSSNVDPLRVAAQVVTGIGFIGAGVIMRDGFSVKGITTAATLWLAGALGMAAGAGAWFPLLAGSLVVAVCLVGLRVVKNYLDRRWRKEVGRITISYAKGSGTIAPILDALEEEDFDLAHLDIDDDDEPDGVRRAILRVRGRSERFDQLMARLRDMPAVTEVTVES